MKIAFITFRDVPALNPGDKLLVKPVESLGHQVFAVPWDRKATDWSSFDAVIPRSCWNYHLKFADFLSWLNSVSRSGPKILNPLEIIRWNAYKTYLFDLEKKGVEIIPSVLVKKNSPSIPEDIFYKFKSEELVIKPTVGASAFNIISVKKSELKYKLKDLDRVLRHSDCLIQPLFEEIYGGEISMVFIDKEFSHAVIKRPRKNEFRVQIELGGTEKPVKLPGEVINAGKKIIDNVAGDLLYARVDGLINKGRFILMELELIEPYLFVEFHPPSAFRFAEALNRLIV
ncbi:MAG: hypothetical protein UV73_C0012G0071 [Candidatus Gottesmanbacteria bacterium GW2011_GWA2_43_14]|uniref:ATP-grasp domain-containing protein n=1 Tax=Candidatus Gottesmanbacteria bacterium GW2011_GWA2_43_14 TaxID=1618443 RepID=A0A0G1GAQ9_9BACT|nr:MAG: hypothetical protein UV73_C0012G0071 [Candidatus Gottesmanbacteria bacterium GW2011_GWA2_43_14]